MLNKQFGEVYDIVKRNLIFKFQFPINFAWIANQTVRILSATRSHYKEKDKKWNRSGKKETNN